ncbi:peptidyl-prolyl cis-trans isomerase FKBP16-4, chloroplastic isoform X4 [Durio zibethinus]|uniref:peptidylprolyl isomerase n=1 Tax=Durio zibethinus TaxID=66656 RepID=A0A6P5WLM9_DURZI|nr:peptidyl-prolyl cis-trans isomerase FKBP16-4, chloroplastic isoform X4 [Durio zibethinus]
MRLPCLIHFHRTFHFTQVLCFSECNCKLFHSEPWFNCLVFSTCHQEIIEGKGPEAHDGDCVQVNYVCRRSNGYFVHSTVDQFSGESSPVTLPLDENQIIKGLKDVLTGMRVGGKRRALIPPSVGYIKENLEPIPDEVSLPVLLIMLSSELSSSPSFGFISILEPAISLHSDSLCRNQVFNKAFSHQVIYFCYILLLSTAVWSSA